MQAKKGNVTKMHKKVEKRCSKSTAQQNLKLFILSKLETGLSPAKIAELGGMKLNALSYHLSSLKAQGLIRRIGYGTWEVCNLGGQKDVQISTVVASKTTSNFDAYLPDKVRGHAFQFKFKLPTNLRNWDRREDLLAKLGVEFKPLLIGGQKRGQKMIFEDRKVWLTDKSIVIYEKASFMADLASEAQSKALSHFLGLLRRLERHLQANFEIHRSRFKVSRQHYALIKNALAKQYDQEGKKLECYTGDGLWFLIDNSFNLHEAETVHPKTAVGDNKKVQDFFNGIKALEGFTPQFVVNTLSMQAQNIDQYAIHLKSHVESVQKLGSAVEELTKVITDIKKKDL